MCGRAAAAGNDRIGKAHRERIDQLLEANKPQSQRIVATNRSAAQLLRALDERQWAPAAELLNESPALLTYGTPPALEHAHFFDMLAQVAAPVLYDMLCVHVHLLAAAPGAVQRLDDAQYAQLQQTLADSPLRGCDLRARPLGAADGSALARLARERRLTTLVWAGLQLGDAGAAQLLQELTAGSDESAPSGSDVTIGGGSAR